MDAHETLVFDSEISVAVLGRGAEFVLIRLNGEIDDATTVRAIERGFRYCGCLGVKDGVPGVRCEPDADALFTMCFAGLEFAVMVAERLKQKAKGEGVEWLTALFALEDPRHEV
jgi:hypothetical protein